MFSQSPNERPSHPVDVARDLTLLPAVVAAVKSAGDVVRSRFSTGSRPEGRDAIGEAIAANDARSMDTLRSALTKVRPGIEWAEEDGRGNLPSGEWWVVDPVEGAINHVHGMTEWGVTTTLVRDNVPMLTVVRLPMTGNTYTAVRDGGAYLDGVQLRSSAKTRLGSALVGTGQALPGEGIEIYHRIGQSVTAMLEVALVVQMSVPATLQLIHVAAGRRDAFWQFSQVRSGLVAGSLLVEEAGGVVTDTHGRPWSLTSADFLAAARGVHAAAVGVLSEIG